MSYGTTAQSIAAINRIANPNLIYPGQVLKIPVSTPTISKAVTYVVKSGDTLLMISMTFKVTVKDIADANNITNANLIYPGQVLTIPLK
jgi:LysM repeat protein